MRGAAAVVGIADLASPTGELDVHGRALEVAMVGAALADAGLTLADVDGVCHPMSSMMFAEYLGIHPRFTDSTMTGGSSFEVHLEHAAAAIAAGLCDVVIDVYGSTPRSDRRRKVNRPRPQMTAPNPAIEWEVPFALRQPMGPYALAASRHMAVYGTTEDHFAEVAVTSYGNALTNPDALFGRKLTVTVGNEIGFDTDDLAGHLLCRICAVVH